MKSTEKKSGQKMTKDEVQKGDLIVTFWDCNGVEVRSKGVAFEKDFENDWKTREGGYLTYNAETEGETSTIFLLERPKPKNKVVYLNTEPVGSHIIGDIWYDTSQNPYITGIWDGNTWAGMKPKPVTEVADGTYWVTEKRYDGIWKVTVTGTRAVWAKGDDNTVDVFTLGYNDLLRYINHGADSGTTVHTKDPRKPIDLLDKKKTYVAKPKTGLGYKHNYYLKFVAEAWRYSSTHDVRTDSHKVEVLDEGMLVEGTASWKKPVEYIPIPEDGLYTIKGRNTGRIYYWVVKNGQVYEGNTLKLAQASADAKYSPLDKEAVTRVVTGKCLYRHTPKPYTMTPQEELDVLGVSNKDIYKSAVSGMLYQFLGSGNMAYSDTSGSGIPQWRTRPVVSSDASDIKKNFKVKI